MTTYSIVITDPFGVRLGDASNFVSLKYSRVVNDVSTLTLVLPSDFPDYLLRLPDGRIEVWRRLASGREYLDTETFWLIKSVQYTRDESGKRQVTVEAVSLLSIFGDPGRVVYGYLTSYVDTVLSSPADTLIQAFVFHAIGANAAIAGIRGLPQIVQTGSFGQGAFVYKNATWRNLLKVLQEIAETSTQNGSYIAFDIVVPTPSTLEFRTYAGQRGVDHRFPSGVNPVLLSPEFGNLGNTTLRKDWTDVASEVYCGGKGEGSTRMLGDQASTALRDVSPFGQRETFIELSNSASQNELDNEAAAELRARRPRITFRGKIIETQDTQYGVHWGWGDYVTAQDFGQSFDCRIDAITVTVEQGKETIEAYVRAET